VPADRADMVHLSRAEAVRLSAHVAHAATAHRQLKEANSEITRARDREAHLKARVCACSRERAVLDAVPVARSGTSHDTLALARLAVVAIQTLALVTRV